MMPNFLKLSCLAIYFFISGCDTLAIYKLRPNLSYEVISTNDEAVSFEVKDKKIVIDLFMNAFNGSIFMKLKAKNFNDKDIIFKPYETQFLYLPTNKIRKPEYVTKWQSFKMHNESHVTLEKDSIVIVSSKQEQFFSLNLDSLASRFNYGGLPEKYSISLKFIDYKNTDFAIDVEVQAN